MAVKLAPILGIIVDQAQAVFVEGRSITENIHLAEELLRQYNRKWISPKCLLKIDLRKAYDSINWNFLRDVLQGWVSLKDLLVGSGNVFLLQLTQLL